MNSVSISTVIDSPIDAVWEIVRDFGGATYLPFEILETRGSGPGATRRIRAPDGVRMLDRLEEIDDARHLISYSLVEAESDPLPISNYRATIQLRPAAGGRTELEWSGKVSIPPDLEKDILPLVTGVYAAGVAGIRAALTRA